MTVLDILEKGFIRFRSCVSVFAVLYAGLIALLTFPYFQGHLVYLNAVKLPFFADLTTPEKYGLSPNRTLNFHLTTPDNESIGAWFVLNDQYYQSLPSIPSDLQAYVKPALKDRPTVLFFHGNAATRAFKVRVAIYKALTSRWNVNVLAIDYRGFADSTGSPSEEGLTRDARTAWDWLLSNGAKADDILIMGHSLGTGVSSQLGALLGNEGTKPRGIVLLSPFSSIREVLDSYHLFGMVPLMKPLALLPGATQLVSWVLVHKFDSLRAVPNITASVLIAHAEDDWDIPASHSDVLFQAYLEPHLPELAVPDFGPKLLSDEEWAKLTAQQVARKEKRATLVDHTDIHNFGSVDEFEADGQTVTLVKTHAGGHDYLPLQEGLQDIIRKKFSVF
ncbi:abhydrolase domain-containing 12 [Ephemerocybe angulata]|uniref:Abhydrolase domain-containing 12 n=1 Tax=Ephemerocybe angulata TaxID=980116 RepID=A0A8H6I2E7_9AGAR|nr:abhydrolase domain-containing 12 [Tulosesus angulatus]